MGEYVGTNIFLVKIILLEQKLFSGLDVVINWIYGCEHLLKM